MINPQEGQQPNTPVASEEERKLIVGAFKDNEKLLKNIRALFLGLDITDEEKQSVRALPDEVKNIIRRRLYPTLDKDAPIGQIKDIWIGAETMVAGKSRDTISQALSYKDASIEMTREALTLLDRDGARIDVSYDPRSDTLGVGLMSRNMFIKHIASQVYFLHVIANQPQETPVQKKKRLAQDSSQ